MKRTGDQWRLRDHVAFFSYRWLAWIVAALAVTIPNRTNGTLPRDAGLLLLIGVITVITTALAQSYVRVLRRRPALLALDIAACAAILWLSGSATMPFMLYSLGALVMPALVFRWPGALLGAAAFAALDAFGFTVINPEAGAAMTGSAIGARIMAPFLFAGAWAAMSRLLPEHLDPRGQHEMDAGASTSQQPQSQPGRQSPTLHVTSLPQPEATDSAPVNLSALTPLLISRAAAEPHPSPARRVLYDLPSSPAVALPAALDQLAAAASRQSGVDVRAACLGAVRPLNPAQHTVLLRCAQEALLNVQQHARARSASLTLSFEPRAVTLVIQDDGVGLLDGTYERPGLHALRAVRYRLAELDGQLAVFDGESGGLTVRATVPLE